MKKKLWKKCRALQVHRPKKICAPLSRERRQAHGRNTNLFAGEARKDPSMSRQIADLFEETANQERAHAKIWFWLVGGSEKGYR